jgi:hypothetical protein
VYFLVLNSLFAQLSNLHKQLPDFSTTKVVSSFLVSTYSLPLGKSDQGA